MQTPFMQVWPSGQQHVLPVGDVLGIAAGTYLASRTDLTPGKVSFVGTLRA